MSYEPIHLVFTVGILLLVALYVQWSTRPRHESRQELDDPLKPHADLSSAIGWKPCTPSVVQVVTPTSELEEAERLFLPTSAKQLIELRQLIAAYKEACGEEPGRVHLGRLAWRELRDEMQLLGLLKKGMESRDFGYVGHLDGVPMFVAMPRHTGANVVQLFNRSPLADKMVVVDTGEVTTDV